MNLIAILVAALVCFVIGFLMHGPVLGKLWMRLANVTPPENASFSMMWKQMVWNYLVNVVTASVLSLAIWVATYSSIMGEMVWYKGAIIAGWLWLGFVATWTSMDVIWMGKSWKLWLFDTLSFLISIAAMGAVLAAWR